MRIGVAKEIKPQEYRVALTPAGARELVQRGHDVVVEEGAGVGSAFADDAGHVTGSYTVSRVIHVGGSTAVDCASAAGTCALAVAFLGDTIDAAKTLLTFEPGGPIVNNEPGDSTTWPSTSILAPSLYGLVTKYPKSFTGAR